MSEHTPGPWEAVKETNSSRGWLVWPSARECQAPGPVAGVTLKGKLGEEEANARLIAASPELYAALEGLLRDEHADDVREIAFAALARARGEE